MKLLKTLLKGLCAIAFVSILSACGFTLRGSGSNQFELSEQFQTIQLQGQNGNSELLRVVRQALATSNITVLEQSQTGVYLLSVSAEQLQERIISINSNARAGEYELLMSVQIQLGSNSEDLITNETFSVERVYLADSNNAVAKTDESELIQSEMRRELARQILNRLQSINP